MPKLQHGRPSPKRERKCCRGVLINTECCATYARATEKDTSNGWILLCESSTHAGSIYDMTEPVPGVIAIPVVRVDFRFVMSMEILKKDPQGFIMTPAFNSEAAFEAF